MTITEQALRERVGRNIREEVDRRGMTLQQLADLAGINLSHLSRALNSKQAMTIDRIARIASALEVDPARLFRPQSARR